MNALQKLITRGATSQSVVLRAQVQASMPIVSASVNSGSTAGLVLKYHRLGDPTAPDGGVSVPLTSTGVGAGLSIPFSAGCVMAIWDGYVRADIPDAAFASAVGVNNVLITASATGIVFTGCMVELTDGNVISASTPQKY